MQHVTFAKMPRAHVWLFAGYQVDREGMLSMMTFVGDKAARLPVKRVDMPAMQYDA